MASDQQDALRERANRCAASIATHYPIYTREPQIADVIERHLRDVQQAAFEAGFYARPANRESWVNHEMHGTPREFEFTPGGSASDIKDEAYAAYLEQQATKETP